MRIISFALLAIAAAQAEPAFVNLESNRDGSRLYFASWLRLKGVPGQYTHSKLFVWDAREGIRLFAQRPATVWGNWRGYSSTTPYQVTGISIASDEKTAALRSMTDCYGGTPCATLSRRYHAEVRRPGAPTIESAGNPSLSPNGRFLLLGSPIVFPLMLPPSTLMDLTTGESVEVLSLAGPADDGSVVISKRDEGKTVLRSRTGAEQSLPDGTTYLLTGLANHVFYFDYGALKLFDVATRQTRQIASFEPSGDPWPRLKASDDGSILAYVKSGQAALVRTADALTIPLLVVSEPVEEVEVSGDGTKIFVVTAASRILRIDVRSLATEEIVPATPMLKIANLPNFRNPLEAEVATPGGLHEFTDASIPKVSLPAVTSVRMFDGIEPHILAADSDRVRVQLPYDLRNGTTWVEMTFDPSSASPFQSAVFGMSPVSVGPWWYRLESDIAALHQDFSGPVTPTSPARPNEIIHLYGAGFGTVSPTPAPGAPASANPLSVLSAPLTCEMRSEGAAQPPVPAQVLFAGLAPGFVGLYQVDLVVPPDIKGAVAVLSCGGVSGSLPVTP